MGARRETARLAKIGTHLVVERAVAAFNAGDGDVDVVADAISLCFECVYARVQLIECRQSRYSGKLLYKCV